MQWSEVLESPYLQNLPFKIELNKFGQVLMSPASNLHGSVQAKVTSLFDQKMKSGVVITKCSVQTREGVRVADVAWASDEFIARHGTATPYLQAPELCVEVVSSSNTKSEIDYKVSLYFAHGAQEVWVVSLQKKVTIYVRGLPAAKSKSKFVPKFKEL